MRRKERTWKYGAANQKLDELWDSAFTERFNRCMDDVMKNAIDPETNPKAKRQIKIVIDVIPNEKRDNAIFKIHVEAKMEPQEPISKFVFLRVCTDGSVIATEVTNQIPGQIDMDG